MKTTLSAKMITFAHGCFGLWQKQSNQKGPTPSIGASPDFSCPAKKNFYRTAIIIYDYLQPFCQKFTKVLIYFYVHKIKKTIFLLFSRSVGAW